MKIGLTNAGQRRASSLLIRSMGRVSARAALGDPLVRLAAAILQPYRASHEQRELVAQGYAQIVPDSTETKDQALRNRRNPLGLVRKLIIECTTRCNYSCSHCYNSGDGWLGLAQKARGTGAAIVSLLSNGWFLGRTAFEAAGQRYADDGAYLRELKAHGVTRVSFSIDGRGQDASRG